MDWLKGECILWQLRFSLGEIWISHKHVSRFRLFSNVCQNANWFLQANCAEMSSSSQTQNSKSKRHLLIGSLSFNGVLRATVKLTQSIWFIWSNNNTKRLAQLVHVECAFDIQPVKLRIFLLLFSFLFSTYCRISHAFCCVFFCASLDSMSHTSWKEMCRKQIVIAWAMDRSCTHYRIQMLAINRNLMLVIHASARGIWHIRSSMRQSKRLRLSTRCQIFYSFVLEYEVNSCSSAMAIFNTAPFIHISTHQSVNSFMENVLFYIHTVNMTHGNVYVR